MLNTCARTHNTNRDGNCASNLACAQDDRGVGNTCFFYNFFTFFSEP